MPATRLRQLHRQLALGQIYGDPLNGHDASLPPSQVTVRIEVQSNHPPELGSRAQQGAPELVVETVGGPPHPNLAELLQDTGRLRNASSRAPHHLESLGDQRRIALRRITQIQESS